MASTTPYIPASLPVKVDYLALTRYLSETNRALASLDATLRHIPNKTLFARTFYTKEAVLSSRIEGTVATLSEVLAYDSEQPQAGPLLDDVIEVVNYRRALEYGRERLQEGDPITENLIKKLHGILLQRGRGESKTPGEFRKIQVYIGSPGAHIEDARFVPPGPQDVIPAFTNLVQYVNSDNEVDPLVKIALTHYQFEAIHPFLDGNGRIGRLLIALQLINEGLLSNPYLYLSESFESNRRDYYDTLNGVSSANDYTSWLRFFLASMAGQARQVENDAIKILELYEQKKKQIVATNSAYAQPLLDAVFEYPVFNAAFITEKSGIKNNKTLHSLINKFIDMKIIAALDPNVQRGKLYGFTELLDITEGDR